jgi:hypothetical protein
VTETETETETGAETVTVTVTVTETVTVTVTETVTVTVTETETVTVTVTVTETVTVTVTETVTVTVAETETVTVTVAVAETVTVTETEAETESGYGREAMRSRASRARVRPASSWPRGTVSSRVRVGSQMPSVPALRENSTCSTSASSMAPSAVRGAGKSAPPYDQNSRRRSVSAIAIASVTANPYGSS